MSDWNVPGITRLLAGVKTEVLRLSGEYPVVHVQIPPGTPRARSEEFAKRVRNELPPEIKIIFTTPGVKIDVKRPKVVNLIVSDCVINKFDLKDRIDDLLSSEADTINIKIHNVEWTDERQT